MMRLITACLALLGALLTSCSPSGGKHNPALDGLDGYLSARQLYETRKLDKIEALRKILPPEGGDPKQRFTVCFNLAEEFFSYKFDSTETWLRRGIAAAEEAGDPLLRTKAEILLADLYSTAGHFLDADRLFSVISGKALPEVLQRAFNYAYYRFARSLQDNPGIIESVPVPDLAACENRVLESFPAHSDIWREVRAAQFLRENRLFSADSLNRLMVKAHNQEEHRYAVVTYVQSVIESAKGDEKACMDWLIESAECDIVNSVKDYASLTVISQILTGQDVDRAFRYLRIAQEDAIFYNARLRPWQISQFFMNIENSYMDRYREISLRTRAIAVLMSVISLALLAALYFLIKRSRKLSRTQKALLSTNQQLETTNARLQLLNKEISEANSIKEEYIGLFLKILSENIDKMAAHDNSIRKKLKQGKTDELLKELSITTRAEDELEAFYHTFDTTFLSLYPDFVEAFNGLLREDERIVLKKGELLNTELRIFALVRLGIEDSTRIANLLHYSVSTIYNYKVKMRNKAAGDREHFEENVKTIGRKM